MKKKYAIELMKQIVECEKQVKSKKQLYVLVGMEKALYCALQLESKRDLRAAKNCVELVAYDISKGKK